MSVLVLNASFEPINVCTVRRAVVLLLKEKAEMLESDKGELHSESTTLERPAVIRLIAYIRIPYATRKRITRKAVFARDNWACQYCGSTSTLTVDHVVPRSKGGEHVWENLASACNKCNTRKGNKTLKEAGMRLHTHPKAPAQDIFVRLHSRKLPDTWTMYLSV